jgi:hypothetical protein
MCVADSWVDGWRFFEPDLATFANCFVGILGKCGVAGRCGG